MGNTRWGILGALLLAVVLVSSGAAAGPEGRTGARAGIDADTVDGHHAAYSGARTARRANRVLWTTKKGQLHKRAMPRGYLNSSFVNDDRAESIGAGTAGFVLTVQNNGGGGGIKGIAGSGGDGVDGQASQTGKSGVYGHHDSDGYGVTGRSASGFGVYAWGAGDTSGYDLLGDLALSGTRGEIFADSYLNLFSNWNVNIALDNDNNDINGALRIWNGTDAQVFRVEEDGDMWALGDVAATGAKSAVVDTESYGTRLLYAVESPGVWFEDFGSAVLTDGVAVVTIEPVFAETVDLGAEYHVFVTPLGDCGGLYVSAKTGTSFEVRELGGGVSDVEFDYRIVAKRLGFEQVRLEPAGNVSTEGDGEPDR